MISAMERLFTVLVVDSQTIVREGLVMLLSSQPDLQIIGHTGELHKILEVPGKCRPDILLIDVAVLGAGKRRALQLIKQRSDTTRILALSALETPDRVRLILDAGADGFATKTSTRDGLLTSVRAALNQSQNPFPCKSTPAFAKRLTPKWSCMNMSLRGNSLHAVSDRCWNWLLNTSRIARSQVSCASAARQLRSIAPV